MKANELLLWLSARREGAWRVSAYHRRAADIDAQVPPVDRASIGDVGLCRAVGRRNADPDTGRYLDCG